MSGIAADKQAFLSFLVEAGALQFGAFTLKSGRVSPYYFNSARFASGGQLERLGRFYGDAVAAAAPGATIVFGPAYKGIPLCVAAAMALERARGRPVGYLFDRKEAKAHGDRGNFVGMAPGPGDRLVLVDDVITDGETKRVAVEQLRAAFDAPIDALVIAFNRMERDAAGGDAVRRFEAATGVPVVALLSLADLEAALEAAPPGEVGPGLPPETLQRIREYRRHYGVGAS